MFPVEKRAMVSYLPSDRRGSDQQEHKKEKTSGKPVKKQKKFSRSFPCQQVVIHDLSVLLGQSCVPTPLVSME